ncbi:MAG TPA: UDP-N-acetylmuramoyl-L-alanine--D-glutamate ligase [Syntrophales bacterium]|nr:UDP-N-acetylmuramoyl-L-alanine--D-glutamate ligase [Syntrophales bacterium]
MELSGRKVLVIGLGKTGTASVRFLAEHGASVAVTDEKPASVGDALKSMAGQASVEARAYGAEAVEGIDLVVPSPGVPPFSPVLAEAVRRGVPVRSEIEVAFGFIRPPLIAITGTNGKTTVTTLVGKILEQGGLRVFVGGNIGEPLIGYAGGSQGDDMVVAEISSFQLQWIRDFRPRVAVLLNVTCDHVDYHGSFEEYRRAKERIFENMGASDLAVLNADDAETEKLARALGTRVQCFSTERRPAHGMFLQDGMLVRAAKDGEERYPAGMVRIPGRHNIENVMAAVLVCRDCGATPQTVLSAVSEFRGLAHRIEYAGEKKGVAFYDDSKGTNVGAVARAVESFSRPSILLLGGRDKEGDFETLAPLIRKKVKRLVLFGEARRLIRDKIGGIVETAEAATLGEAVKAAFRGAAAGDVVLLSPGCASFDEFTSYSQRGDFFKKAVKELPDD